MARPMCREVDGSMSRSSCVSGCEGSLVRCRVVGRCPVPRCSPRPHAAAHTRSAQDVTYIISRARLVVGCGRALPYARTLAELIISLSTVYPPRVSPQYTSWRSATPEIRRRPARAQRDGRQREGGASIQWSRARDGTRRDQARRGPRGEREASARLAERAWERNGTEGWRVFVFVSVRPSGHIRALGAWTQFSGRRAESRNRLRSACVGPCSCHCVCCSVVAGGR